MTTGTIRGRVVEVVSNVLPVVNVWVTSSGAPDPHTPTDENDPDEDGDVSPDVRNDPVPDDPAPQPDEEGEEPE